MESRPRERRQFSGTSKPSFTELPDDDRRLIERFLGGLQGIVQAGGVVLFGSLARGEFDRRSDIDLLVIVDHEVPQTLNRKIARMVTALKPHRDINAIPTNLRDLDPSFLRNVFREGVVLQGKFVLTPGHLALTPRVLVSYDLTGLPPGKKVQVSRKVHGFASTKDVGGRRTTYRYEGLKDRYAATVVSPSVLMLSDEDATALIEDLRSAGAKVSRWDVFTAG